MKNPIINHKDETFHPQVGSQIPYPQASKKGAEENFSDGVNPGPADPGYTLSLQTV